MGTDLPTDNSLSLTRFFPHGFHQTARNPAPKGGYRPELDAIRGVAILMVLAEHFGYSPAWTGVLGVYVFFVLSGYLITGLLMDERERTGTVSLRAFYVRRFRRLMPALAAMVAVVVALRLPGNPVVALTYTTNWYIGLTGADMGALRHTWSLGLEEQFYLAWPFLFLVLPRRLTVPALVVGIAATSLLVDQWANDAIIAGCLLAILRLRLPAWTAWLGWLALGAIAFAGIPAPHPLFNLAVLCGVVIVGSGGGITWRPLVRLGQISYGVYLWHFPIAFVLQPALTGALHPLSAALGVLLALLVALLSERFIERPFRLPSGVRRGVEQRSGAVRDVAVGERAVDVHRADEDDWRDRPTRSRRDAPVSGAASSDVARVDLQQVG